MWFVFALVTILAWGAADLFYKKGAVESDRYSHLKTAMLVGFVMGAHAIATLLVSGLDYDPVNLIVYMPVSLMYILSMTVGYLGLRYLQLSISSPVQNASGAVTCILCLVFLAQAMDAISAVGVVLICGGVIVLGILENRAERPALTPANKKYRFGFTAFLFPVLYCVIDALGTFFDAYYLDDFASTPLIGVTEETLENVANISYELTFLFAAIVIFVFLRFIKREKLYPREQKHRLFAALLETAGQSAYVFAMSGNGVVAAPMIASYSIVSVLLSRLFLKERLTRAQYAVVTIVIVGIALLGVADGLAE